MVKLNKYNKILTNEFLYEEYIKKDKTIREISEKLNCSTFTVHLYLKKFNIKRRKYGEWWRGVTPKNYKHGLKSKCIDCNKEIYYKSKRCSSCSKRLSLGSNWRGGISFDPYPTDWCNKLKEKIRKRDNYNCQICEIEQVELKRKLDVHHIDYDKSNCDNSNLISLCKSCHTKTNYNREYWKKYFIEKYREEQKQLGLI